MSTRRRYITSYVPEIQAETPPSAADPSQKSPHFSPSATPLFSLQSPIDASIATMDELPWALQQERRRCVGADAARKRSAHKWTGRGLPVPASLLRRETVEFDILHGLLPAPAPPAAPPPPTAPPQFVEGSSSNS